MDLLELQRKLLAAARHHQPSDQVPFGFEGRIMALLRAARPEDEWAVWGRALWHAAVGSLALSMVLSLWLLLPGKSEVGPRNLSQVYDSTLYAAAEQLSDSW